MRARTCILMIAASFVVLGAAPAQAGPHTPGMDRRQARDMQRIERGIATGALTRPEAGYLLEQQASIRALEARMWANGVVSPRERLRLRHELRIASRDIARLSRNPSRRGF